MLKNVTPVFIECDNIWIYTILQIRQVEYENMGGFHH